VSATAPGQWQVGMKVFPAGITFLTVEASDLASAEVAATRRAEELGLNVVRVVSATEMFSGPHHLVAPFIHLEAAE
jgi:hypothetical protein